MPQSRHAPASAGGVRPSVRPSVLLLAALAALAGCADMATDPQLEPTAGEMARKPKPAPAPAPAPTGSFFVDAKLYVEPTSHARSTADAWKLTRPADAQQMEKIATRSQAMWFGEWSGEIRGAVDRAVTTVTAAGALPTLVAYNIPQRDCGGLSGGGGATADAYRSWISAFAEGIGTRRAVVVLEPDALAMLDCVPAADQQTRLDLLRHAVSVFRAKGNTHVYIDAGHSRWHSAAVMADRLTRVDVANARGFSLNISNFQTTASNLTYGEQLSSLIGGKSFVIDTSRNGVGPTADNQWCNPSGRALGNAPTGSTGHALADAFLWLKRPGESDGACNGGPAAGQWWAEYALGLAQRAAY